jgi:hypothetical protein
MISNLWLIFAFDISIWQKIRFEYLRNHPDPSFSTRFNGLELSTTTSIVSTFFQTQAYTLSLKGVFEYLRNHPDPSFSTQFNRLELGITTSIDPTWLS